MGDDLLQFIAHFVNSCKDCLQCQFQSCKESPWHPGAVDIA